MHTITLEVNDSMYEHFLYLLKQLNPKEVKVIEEKQCEKDTSLKQKLHKLFDETDITAFKNIDDPVAWQRLQREEWEK
jgi:hypothetical protein